MPKQPIFANNPGARNRAGQQTLPKAGRGRLGTEDRLHSGNAGRLLTNSERLMGFDVEQAFDAHQQ